MSEPIYTTLLGLYLTLEDYRKAVKPGQTVYVWLPPDLNRVEGIAGQAFGPGMTEPILVVKLKDRSGFIEVTENNVFLFEPGR